MQKLKRFFDACSFVFGAMTVLSIASSMTPMVHADVDLGAMSICNSASCTCPVPPGNCGTAGAPTDCESPCQCVGTECLHV